MAVGHAICSTEKTFVQHTYTTAHRPDYGRPVANTKTTNATTKVRGTGNGPWTFTTSTGPTWKEMVWNMLSRTG